MPGNLTGFKEITPGQQDLENGEIDLNYLSRIKLNGLDIVQIGMDQQFAHRQGNGRIGAVFK